MADRLTRLEPYVSYASWICVAILIVLSLLPGSERLHTGLAGKLERLIACAGTGAVAVVGYPTPWQRLIFWASVATLIFVLEYLQRYAPGGHADVLDSIAFLPA